jgi:hypothetical protein
MNHNLLQIFVVSAFWWQETGRLTNVFNFVIVVQHIDTNQSYSLPALRVDQADLCSQVISSKNKRKVIIKAVKQLDIPARFSLSNRFPIYCVETISSSKAGCKNREARLDKSIQKGVVCNFHNRDNAFSFFRFDC